MSITTIILNWTEILSNILVVLLGGLSGYIIYLQLEVVFHNMIVF